jgi:hypothetical protein
MNTDQRLETIEATLNYRLGYRYLIDPHPRFTDAVSISAAIKESCDESKDDYKEALASAAGVNPKNVRFRQEFRILPEGTTRVVNWPLVIYENGRKSFNNRLCIAVCSGSTSTKVWSRVSSSVGIDGTVFSIPINDVQKYHKYYRDIAFHSIDWVTPKILDIANKCLSDTVVERGRRIDVVILGVNDEYLAEPFLELNEQARAVADILADIVGDSVLDSRLTSYYRNISDIDVMLSDCVNNNNASAEPSLLFSLPLSVTTSSGYMEQRTVLFLLREKDEYTEILGLAYDDSLEMDIPLRAAPKLIRTIGHWF